MTNYGRETLEGLGSTILERASVLGGSVEADVIDHELEAGMSDPGTSTMSGIPARSRPARAFS